MYFPGKGALPRLGVGLSFRSEIARQICEHAQELDFAEVIIESEMKGRLSPLFWSSIAGTMPLVAHGIDVSLGSLDDLDIDYLKRIDIVGRKMRCAWFSEHLAFTHSEGVDTGRLTPLQFSARNAAFVAGKINRVCELLEFPVLLENIPHYYLIPGSNLTEIEFFLQVLQQARCGVLLDINNLYANSVNHGFDPYAYIDRIPESLVTELHVAGGQWRDGVYIDTHGHALNPHVLDLVEYAIRTKRPHAILLEREQNFPPIAELMSEIRTLRALWTKHPVE